MSDNLIKNHYRIVVFVGLALGLAFSTNAASGTTITIATFADPAADASTPLFTVTFGTSGSVAGGWDDSQTGLDLEVPLTGGLYEDAFFQMDPLTFNGDASGGVAGGGAIKFFDDNDNPDIAVPLVSITFSSGQLDPGSFYADDLFHLNNVQITVKDYPQTLSQEQFSFAFANKVMLGGACPTGFTATAAFTSSAIPEPATMILLSLGSLVLIRRRKFVPKIS